MIVDAMVFRAGLAPLNKTAIGYRDWVGVVTDLGGGPLALWSLDKTDKTHWLVPGTRCRVDVEPEHAGTHKCFSIDHASVPTVAERVAAADPTFTDPIGSRRAAKAAFAGAREIKPMFNTMMGPGEAYHTPQTGPGLDDNWFTQCEQAVGAAGDPQAAAGTIRAVAIVTAMRLLLRDTGRDLSTGAPRRADRTDGLGPYRKAMSGNETVFAVHAPGRAPWATFVKDFKAPDDKPVDRMLRVYPYLPVVAPATGDGPVAVVWDEVPPPSRITMDLRTLAQTNPFALIAQVKAARRAAAAQQQMYPGQRAGYPQRGGYPQQPGYPQQGGYPPAGYPPQAGAGGPDDMPPVAHQAAARFVAYLRSLPPPAHPHAIQQAVASLAAYPPQERERYLALWRQYGIPV